MKWKRFNDNPKKNGINGRVEPKAGAPPSTSEAIIVANLSACSTTVLLFLSFLGLVLIGTNIFRY